MIRFIALLFTLTPIFFTTFPSSVDAAAPKEETIKELMKVMNTMENLEKSLQTMKESIKMNSPYFIKEIKVIMAREMEEEYVQLAADKYREGDYGAGRLYELFRYKFNLERVEKEVMIPVYQENYSEEEIQQLIAFYKSDLGQKTLKLTPIISRTISSKTRDLSQMALNQAKEEIAFELIKSIQQ